MFRTIPFAAVCLLACGLQAAELHLRREASPAGSLVTLGDVAEILANDAQAKDHLAKIELFPAPNAGSSRLVRADEVRDTLARRGIDLRQVRFVGASSIWIHGGSGETKPAEKIARPAVVPAIAYEGDITTTQVVVPVRQLQRGDVIRASDVQLQTHRGEAIDGAATELDAVIGKQLTRPMPKGTAIPVAELQSPQLVQKNEVVTVYARTRGVQVRTSARAMESGARGDIIALESLLDRNAHFTARVVGTKEVEVLAGAPLVTSPVAPMPGAATPAPPASAARGSMFGLRVRVNDAATTPR